MSHSHTHALLYHSTLLQGPSQIPRHWLDLVPSSGKKEHAQRASPRVNWRQGSRQRPSCTYQKLTHPLSPANWVLVWSSGVVASGPAKLGPRLEGLESGHGQNHFPIRSSPPIFIHIGHGSRSVPIRPLHFHPSTTNLVCYSLLPTLVSGGCALGPVFFPKLSAVPVHGWLRHHPLKLFCFFHLLLSFDNLLDSSYCCHFTLHNQEKTPFASGACPCCHSFFRSHPLGSHPGRAVNTVAFPAENTLPSSSAPTGT